MPTNVPKSWLDLLASIRERPGMWLGHASLQGLQQFINGASLAERIYPELTPERIQQVNDFPWQAFEAYIARRYNPLQLSLNSFSLAQFYAEGQTLTDFPRQDYAGAWELWWRWFDEFMAAQASEQGRAS
jgi:hypothetical protein